MSHLEWMRQGRWSRVTNYGAGSASRPGKIAEPDWLTTMHGFGLIADALYARGMSEEEVAAVMGGNWLRLYSEVFN